jgi:hypothetical protein
MAQKVAAATGAWSTAATWNSVTNAPTIHASTNITLNSTTGIFTAGFTAPDLVSACTGVLLFVTTVPVTATYVVTLQESTVDTAATVSVLASAFPIANNLIYFRFATPYVFTTLTASAYRFKITRASATTNAIVAADSGGANPLFWATTDQTGVPGATDDVWIVTANGTGTITVTMDGTQTIGSGTNTTGISQRTIGNAVTISQGGLLTWDTATSAQLTSKGNVTAGGGGELRMGTVATPYPTGQTAVLAFNENGVGGRYGLETYVAGKLTLQGEPKTTTSLWKTTYVSGAGTAADPLIVADAVDWAVGDEILVCAYSANATNYQETENKFIITKNSPTSYVLSNTAGGVEAALTYTHTAGAYVLNIQRNVIIKSSTTTEGFYYYNINDTVGDVDVDWARFEVAGSSASNKSGILLTTRITFDYSVVYGFTFYGFYFLGDSYSTDSFTGLIACNSSTATGVNAFHIACRGKIFNDCFAVKNRLTGFFVAQSSSVLNRCVAISNNTIGSAVNNANAPIYISGATHSFNNCESHCNRTKGLTLNGAVDTTFNLLLCGTKGTNAIDVNILGSSYNQITFVNSTFGSAIFVQGYTGMTGGSSVNFHTLNGTANNHVWYTDTGVARSTGVGLADTTNKTAGNLTVRLASENLTAGFVWEFLVGIKASTAASIFGFAQKNVAFGTDVCTIELFLPGSIVADATATLDNTTGAWQVFNLAASYTGLVAGFATIRITTKTATAAAYVYFTDFYNGTNVLTGLQAWHKGKPSPVFTDLLGDPASVWAILESTLTTVGTIGYKVVQYLNSLQADTDDLQTRIPAALVGGRMDSSVGTMAANTLTASALATDAVNEIVTAVYAATMEGLTFEEIIKEVWAQVAGDAVANDATNPTLLEYDGPDGTVELTHTRTPTTRTRV